MAGPSPASFDEALVFVAGTPSAADWLVIAPVIWCMALGAVLTMMRARTRLQPGIAIAGLGVLVLLDARLLAHVAENGPVTMMMGRWLPPFGIAFTADLTGALFALAAAVIALFLAVAALAEVNDSARRYGFFPFLMLLMAGVTGAFLTGDLFNLYVWFEVLLMSSFGLIVLGAERAQLDGTLKYAILNLIGTTLFLIATGLVYATFGTLNMADLVLKLADAPPSSPVMTLALLLALAFGMKAAAFPLHVWLPASYHTPGFVVSALFAALMTKVGIYALLRVCVMLFAGQTDGLGLLIALSAAASMLVGCLGALASADIRRMIGYLLIAGIGSTLAGIAIGGEAAIGGAIVYSLHSMVVMAALYVAAGIAARLGALTLNDAAGLTRQQPLFASLSLMLFFSVSGLPPFSGFWPKVILVKASLDSGAWWLALMLLLTGFLTMIASIRLFLFVYWRMPADAAPVRAAAIIPAPAMLALGCLTAFSLAIGLFPESLLHLVQRAAIGLIDPSAYIGSVFPEAGR